jgi:hypothetical protein
MAIVLMLTFALPLRAQVATGSFGGNVKDGQGSVLPGVLITVQGVDATQTSTTDGAGEFRFLNLASGTYKHARKQRPAENRPGMLGRRGAW